MHFHAGSASDWVLDLVATGFTKPEHLLGDTMCTKNDVDAAADAFKAHCIKVRQKTAGCCEQKRRLECVKQWVVQANPQAFSSPA